MPAEVFLDTNILIHFVELNSLKAAEAERLVRAGAVVSVQVLNEFSNVARRKLQMSWEDVRLVIAGVRATCAVVPVTVDVHERGLAYAERHQLALYDAMIVAAAVLNGCTTLFTEDMHNGLVVDGMTVRNPYSA